jgi:hypothetical protein
LMLRRRQSKYCPDRLGVSEAGWRIDSGQMRDDFGAYWFDETNCAEGLRHLGLDRKEWNDRLGCWRETPRQDGHQHAVDALRQKAQAWSEPSKRRRKHRYRSAMAA